ncbi:ribonuclease HII [archaeon]|jgi:ribonuclease HII|nr:ribonuclease HII [archaeon]
MKEWILGIDDAGRGPVMGPMILAGCLIEKTLEKELKQLGVKDSKQITPKRREFLNEKIREKAEAFEISVCFPEEIDSQNGEGIKLNELEAIHIAAIINKINKGYGKIKVVVDCPSPSIAKWSDYLRSKIKSLSNIELVCEHKADRNHLAVGAASILAKSIREKEMTKLKKIYGEEIGSGYTSDPSTIRFLEKYAAKHQNTGLFRKTWITWKKAFDNLSQQTLGCLL